ncbi:hypothetical protein BDW59DRAFT_168100 [Aspergillus cavernicola]|uniref:Uncharacterized protein n=1 Tax=Aspergillus cavernicola TaxID=176166 RepID=A0ABR4H7M8_9EURO
MSLPNISDTLANALDLLELEAEEPKVSTKVAHIITAWKAAPFIRHLKCWKDSDSEEILRQDLEKGLHEALAVIKTKTHVLGPLLEDQEFKPFHPVLENVRQQIDDRRISCLRDIGKELFLLALKVEANDDAYIKFWRDTITRLSQIFSFSDADLCMSKDKQDNISYLLGLSEQVAHSKGINESMLNAHGWGYLCLNLTNRKRLD